MELIESIESINEQLIREFGLEFNGDPKFRIVFSEDILEKRWSEYSLEGFQLVHPEVQERPRYRQWVRDKYILERLVPVGPESDLVAKISYESCWVFADRHGNYLPPRFDICKFVIETLLDNVSKAGNHVKYRDPEIDPNVRTQKLQDMVNLLFGNETDTGDALAYGSGVSLSTPAKQEKETIQ